MPIRLVPTRDKIMSTVNLKLAKERNISEENIKEIEKLHLIRKALHEAMENDEEKYLPYYDDELDKIEMELQKLWGFPENSNYIKFWERPRCECPQLDNEDNYPSGYYIVNENCPLHGGKI